MQTTKVIHACDVLIRMDETQGQRLKRLRKAMKMTQKDLGKFVGLGQTAIANIEADTRGYGAGIIGIAKALGTTPEYLQLEDQVKASTLSIDTQNLRVSNGWPFVTVTPLQYDLLEPDDRAAIEQHIHLFIKARGDPEKHETPANYRASA